MTVLRLGTASRCAGFSGSTRWGYLYWYSAEDLPMYTRNKTPFLPLQRNNISGARSLDSDQEFFLFRSLDSQNITGGVEAKSRDCMPKPAPCL